MLNKKPFNGCLGGIQVNRGKPFFLGIIGKLGNLGVIC